MRKERLLAAFGLILIGASVTAEGYLPMANDKCCYQAQIGPPLPSLPCEEICVETCSYAGSSAYQTVQSEAVCGGSGGYCGARKPLGPGGAVQFEMTCESFPSFGCEDEDEVFCAWFLLTGGDHHYVASCYQGVDTLCD